jgi:hypothetical protein
VLGEKESSKAVVAHHPPQFSNEEEGDERAKDKSRSHE